MSVPVVKASQCIKRLNQRKPVLQPRNRNLGISRAPMKIQAHQGISLLTSTIPQNSGFNTDYGSSEPLKTLVMLCNLLATFLVRALTTFNKKTYCLNLLPDIYPSRSACIIACVLLSVKILQVLVMLVSLVGTILLLKI